MNIDDPKLTAYTLGELSGEEKSQVEAAMAESPEAQRVVSETQELAKMLSLEYEAERKAEPVTPVNLIDIRDDPWFWSIARPLSIAAVITVFALISAIAVSTYKRGGMAGRAEGFASNGKDSLTIELPSSLAPAEVKPFADVEGEVGPQPAATPLAVAKAEADRTTVTGSNIPTGEEVAPNSIDGLSGPAVRLGVRPSAKAVGKQPASPTQRGAPLAGTGDDKTNIVVQSEYYNRGAIFSR